MNSVNEVLFFIFGKQTNLSVKMKKSNQGEKVRGVLMSTSGTCRRQNETDHELSQANGPFSVDWNMELKKKSLIFSIGL